ncbi:putative F-box protein At1g33530 [Salvia hispanica]|uniref:putative F-box protein At1g33530 n=1 Tax=Salvia hispanica TaxID=49212 RepID=UPI0020094C8B|nr:putative F-box protein At1g33530 [Salvia hispanica]
MEDMFANLPEELVSDILRRLSIRSVMTCKCVCRSWRRLIKGDEFASPYTSKPGLSFVHRDGREYTVFDGAFKPLFRFGFPEGWNFHVVIASVNGLLAVWDHDKYAIQMFVCNPMTREYAMLPPLMGAGFFFGFGVSKLSGLYKILYGDQYSSCHVYTLGRGSSGREWRSITSTAPGVPTLGGDCAKFLNGNLHWLVSNIEKNDLVCSFDIETELFTSFSPPHDYGGNPYGNNHLYILEGQLCLCDILNSNHVVVWKMNSYGDENSWIKEYKFLLHVSLSYFDFYRGIAYKIQSFGK